MRHPQGKALKWEAWLTPKLSEPLLSNHTSLIKSLKVASVQIMSWERQYISHEDSYSHLNYCMNHILLQWIVLKSSFSVLILHTEYFQLVIIVNGTIADRLMSSYNTEESYIGGLHYYGRRACGHKKGVSCHNGNLLFILQL